MPAWYLDGRLLLGMGLHPHWRLRRNHDRPGRKGSLRLQHCYQHGLCYRLGSLLRCREHLCLNLLFCEGDSGNGSRVASVSIMPYVYVLASAAFRYSTTLSIRGSFQCTMICCSIRRAGVAYLVVTFIVVFGLAAFPMVLETLLQDILNKRQKKELPIVAYAFPLLLSCAELGSSLETKPPIKNDPCLSRKE